MDEFDLIERIVSGLGAQSDSPLVVTGPGDDAAVLKVPAGHQVVSSIDTLHVDRHFPATAPAALIGYRAVMVAVSDLAAMAADPHYVLISLSLPQADVAWVESLAQGIGQAAQRCDIPVVGGNLSRGPLSLTISVHGLVPEGCAVGRDGALVGDIVQVSGTVGGAASCVRQQQWQIGAHMTAPQRAYYQPLARLDLTPALRASAHAAIDVSDGLLQDLQHICNASGVGAELYSQELPLADEASLADALQGGDDYQLLVAAATELPDFTAIGRVVAARHLHVDGRPVELRGYDHFGA